MKTAFLDNDSLASSRLIYGCMRIAGDNSARNKGKRALQAALEAGYNHFDHADIYGGGACESLFGELLAEKPHVREQIIITSKAGIRLPVNDSDGPKRYDFTQQYLLNSVDASLKRLNTDHLDMFLLHRPDYLFDAHEVAETFALLKASGKVKHFGVSNFTPSQVSLLTSVLPMPLLVNQVEINIYNINSLVDGTLDQCQQHGITPIAWCPLGGVVYPAWGNTFSVEDEQRIAHEFAQQSEKYGIDPWQVMLSWLLKHPAGICPIIGLSLIHI